MGYYFVHYTPAEAFTLQVDALERPHPCQPRQLAEMPSLDAEGCPLFVSIMEHPRRGALATPAAGFGEALAAGFVTTSHDGSGRVTHIGLTEAGRRLMVSVYNAQDDEKEARRSSF